MKIRMLPLKDVSIVITSARPHKAELMARMIAAKGGEPIYLPVLRIEGAGEGVSQFLESVRGFDAFVFLTGQSVISLVDQAEREGAKEILVELLQGTEVYCRGSKAAGNLRSRLGIECSAVTETVRDLLDVLKNKVRGRKIAVSFYGVLDEEFLKELSDTAEEVRYVKLYDTRADELENVQRIASLIEGGEADVVTFTSKLGVKAFCEGLQRLGKIEAVKRQIEEGNTVVASIGPVTSEELRRWGFTPQIEPEKHFIGYLVDAIAKYFESRRSRWA